VSKNIADQVSLFTSCSFSISSMFVQCEVHRVPSPQAWLQGLPTQMLNLLHLGCSMKEAASLLLSLLLLWHSEWKLLEAVAALQKLHQKISFFNTEAFSSTSKLQLLFFFSPNYMQMKLKSILLLLSTSILMLDTKPFTF